MDERRRPWIGLDRAWKPEFVLVHLAMIDL
jgi:hypothetical protein